MASTPLLVSLPPLGPLPPTPSSNGSKRSSVLLVKGTDRSDDNVPLKLDVQYDEAMERAWRYEDGVEADSSDSDIDPVLDLHLPVLSSSSGTLTPKSFQRNTSSYFATSPTPPPSSPLPSAPPSPSPRSHTSLSTWAPSHPPAHLLPPTKHSHLPPITTSAPTSLPLPASTLTALQASLAYSLTRLLSLPTFSRYLLDSPNGFTSFHSYLSSPTAQARLELWRDMALLHERTNASAVAARGVRDVYLVPDGEREVEGLERKELMNAVEGLRGIISAGKGLERVSRDLLGSLYEKEFNGYVRHRLLKQTSVQLGRHDLEATDRQGLGDAFCLTNPRLPDHPIVLVSEAFTALTGYPASQIVGRNCRFLQGKDRTSPESVTAVREALLKEEGVTQLLLNFRLDGSPFWNLLTILPLRDARGEIAYFIGGQTNVTGKLTNGSDFSFILSDDTASSSSSSTMSSHVSPLVKTGQFSSAVQKYAKQHPTLPDGAETRPPSLAPTSRAPSIAPSEPVVAPKGRRFSMFFNKKSKAPKPKTETQRLPGAETMAPSPIELAISTFQSTYERILVFLPLHHEILFVSSGLLRFIGLPGASMRDVFESPLVHMNLVDDLLVSDPRGVAGITDSEVRKRVKKAVKEGRSDSLPCGIRLREQRKAFARAKEPLTSTVSMVMHLTPLLDLQGSAIAFVVVFGAPGA